ncbi:MAG: putative glycine dehydrogenase (decarboxylating) subunit 1 [Candidatus Omnitrophica bacterium ADurb.Bin277]|nr:MAG: putative glycine dehydrogenase (decarboxylating) subunit 1 [Candidatus Omnitrophica bacterium ADurb.Bin277]
MHHSSLNPIHRQVAETHAANLGLDIVEGDDPTDAACVVVQLPSFIGTLADYSCLAQRCHDAGALLVASFYPVALGIVKTPGEMGADIAVAEGQSLGIPAGFGGPYLGVLATRKAHVRKMPGRLAAATQDAQGRRGFVLTLQAREQHIRREKAMSNICSNQALCALTACAYMTFLGKQGILEVAELNFDRASYLRERISKLGGFEVDLTAPIFNEFRVKSRKPFPQIEKRLMEGGIFPGVALEPFYPELKDEFLVCATETKTREELDRFVEALSRC